MPCFTQSPGLCRNPKRRVVESQLPRMFLGRRVSPEPLLLPLDSILAFRGISSTGLLPTLLPSARGGRTTALLGLPPNDLADPSASHVRGCSQGTGPLSRPTLTHGSQGLPLTNYDGTPLPGPQAFVPRPSSTSPHCPLPFSPAGTWALAFPLPH